MMLKFLLAATLAALVGLSGGKAALAQEAQAGPAGARKILIAYFSWSGNTREIAGRIQGKVGGDLLEIKTVKPYPGDYDDCVKQAKQEQADNARPALATELKDLAAYDLIFIGFPDWWGTLPMPLFTFLEKYNLAGKTILSFCTHGGSGLGRSEKDLAKLCPEATLREGLAIRGESVKSAQASASVDAWLKKQGLIN